jgi:hypothetical protein
LRRAGECIFHVAAFLISPFFLSFPESPSDTIRPQVSGAATDSSEDAFCSEPGNSNLGVDVDSYSSEEELKEIIRQGLIVLIFGDLGINLVDEASF